jgi:hypothetical protein
MSLELVEGVDISKQKGKIVPNKKINDDKQRQYSIQTQKKHYQKVKPYTALAKIKSDDDCLRELILIRFPELKEVPSHELMVPICLMISELNKLK